MAMLTVAKIGHMKLFPWELRMVKIWHYANHQNWILFLPLFWQMFWSSSNSSWQITGITQWKTSEQKRQPPQKSFEFFTSCWRISEILKPVLRAEIKLILPQFHKFFCWSATEKNLTVWSSWLLSDDFRLLVLAITSNFWLALR